MKASANYPIYTAIVVAADGTKYTLTNATTDLLLDEGEGELAQKVSLSLQNIKAGTKQLSACLGLKMRLYVYANDGEKKEEVFRGFLWEIGNTNSDDNALSITAYDHLIYTQKSKDCIYFSAGKYSDAVVKAIFNKWKIKCSYAYSKIKHPKLPLNNKTLADMVIEVLDAVKKQTGAKYVIRSIKDVATISKAGSNTEIYHFQKKKSAISTKSTVTMDGLITKVVIYGNEDDNERRAVAATVNGSNISTYGTLQDVVLMSGNTKLSEAKKEANEILKENGKPKKTHTLETPDVPWVHKGDLIKVTAGDLNGNYLVLSISHDAMNKTMSMEVEKA